MFECSELNTPCLLLDPQKMQANIQRMHQHIASLGGVLRPHAKTAKSMAVMQQVLDEHCRGLTVSTLSEAEYFFAHGVSDLLYAVGIAPQKLPRALALIRQGADLKLLLDSVAQVQAVSEQARLAGLTVKLVVELDSDGQRAGLPVDSADLLAVAQAAADLPGVCFHGIITHAGASYDCRSIAEIQAMARQEQSAAVEAARRLAAAGLPCTMVSIGSTPTAQFSQDLSGISEVRAGVYLFHDLVMAGLGVCQVDQIAISVLTAVIGHQRSKQELIIDAGWMALSRDRGTARQAQDQGYGLVCDAQGRILPDLLVSTTNQEHGIVRQRDGASLNFDAYPVGSLLRILPNHACATGAMFEAYQVLNTGLDGVDHWPRIRGW